MDVESWCSAGGENGLQPGDTITALDGRRITIYQDFTLATMLLPDGNYDITVLRNGETVVLEDVPMVRQPVQYEDGTTGMLYGLTFSSADTTAESVPGRRMGGRCGSGFPDRAGIGADLRHRPVREPDMDVDRRRRPARGWKLPR